MGRSGARYGAISYIFQNLITEVNDSNSLDVFLDNFYYKKEQVKYIKDVVNGIYLNLSTIDSLIEKNLSGWEIDRIPKVDLSILRVAVYEILFRDDIPISVSINEAVENGKELSSPDAYKYINGVLASIIKEIDGNESSNS